MVNDINLSPLLLFSARVLLALRVTGVTLEQMDYQDFLVKWEIRAALGLEHQGNMVRRAALEFTACQGILEIQV